MKRSLLSKTLGLLNALLPPILWASFIFFLSAQSTLPVPSSAIFNKLFTQSAHFFVYAILHFLLWRAQQILASQSSKKNLWLPLGLAFLYALSDECHQSFTPGRDPSWIDILFDSSGIIFSQLTISHYLTHRQKKIHSHTLLKNNNPFRKGSHD